MSNWLMEDGTQVAEPKEIPMKGYKHGDWKHLLHAPVEIRHGGKTVRAGLVDAVMPDSSALWIAAEGNLPRQMYDAARGYEVWVTPRELDGHSAFRMTSELLAGGLKQPGVLATTGDQPSDAPS
ncbi:hypothetical protein [Arthrobacter globiformis]|uniref:hypothetical protein n=1 Tax=Arthrobacter globiformis TaxID=1665 RepID=UPI002785E850|nr:hypothetical protein [Arthrobacter globiformis]MDQ0864540.1 hypothetical protein [Arthrobacter globiformis]